MAHAILVPDHQFDISPVDELNFFLGETRVPMELCIRVRDHFHATREITKRRTYNELFERMSPGLRGEIVLQLSKRTLDAVPYFRAAGVAEPKFLIFVAQKLTHEAFAPRERMLYAAQLNVVAFGVAGRGGEMLSAGQYWGEVRCPRRLGGCDCRTGSLHALAVSDNFPSPISSPIIDSGHDRDESFAARHALCHRSHLYRAIYPCAREPGGDASSLSQSKGGSAPNRSNDSVASLDHAHCWIHKKER